MCVFQFFITDNKLIRNIIDSLIHVIILFPDSTHVMFCRHVCTFCSYPIKGILHNSNCHTRKFYSKFTGLFKLFPIYLLIY